MSQVMSHIATNIKPRHAPDGHYSGRAFTVAGFYRCPMVLRIRQLREAKGWTQADLAERSRMSRSQLAMIEAETRPANTLRLNAIATALGVVTEDLFDSGSDDGRFTRVLRQLSEADRALVLTLAESLAAKTSTD